jgi:hypothetical protein
MIEEFVLNIATPLGIDITSVSLVEGHLLGCKDAHLLNMTSKGHVVSALIFKTDIENLQRGVGCDRLEVMIRASLSRLQLHKVYRNSCVSAA